MVLTVGVPAGSQEAVLFAEWKSTGSNSGPRGAFRNPLLYSSAAVLLGLFYVGGVFFIRWQENRAYQRKAAQAQTEKRAEDEQDFELMGGDRFEILNFYISPPAIQAGETAHLCYGVSNTQSVKLDPPIAEMWPALSRCIPVEPKKDTTYTITAEDGAGHTKTAEVTLSVR